MTRALYVGSFDPYTLGHENIADKAAKLFDTLIVGVADNIRKKYLFTKEQRKKMVSFDGEVVIINGLVSDFVKKENIDCLVRGLRNPFDMDHELALAAFNKDLCGVETVYLFSDAKYRDIHSKYLQELIAYNKDISQYVPAKTLKVLSDFK